MNAITSPLAPGWHFEVEETSPSAYRAEGRNGAGRKVTSQSADDLRALADCIKYAFDTLETKPSLTSWEVGPEYDGPHKVQLQRTLKALGYARGRVDVAVGGSQELTSSVWLGSRGHLLIEAETYMGLIVRGTDVNIEELRHVFERPVG